MNNGYSSNNKKSAFAFYVTRCSFIHKISSQSCIVNSSFSLAFKWSLTNGRTLEVVSFFMLNGLYVSKRWRKKKYTLKFFNDLMHD